VYERWPLSGASAWRDVTDSVESTTIFTPVPKLAAIGPSPLPNTSIISDGNGPGDPTFFPSCPLQNFVNLFKQIYRLLVSEDSYERIVGAFEGFQRGN
jgi:hypothetical protein